MQRNKLKLLLFLSLTIACFLTSNYKSNAQMCGPIWLGIGEIDLGRLTYTPFQWNNDASVSANVRIYTGIAPPVVAVDWSSFINGLKPISDEAAIEYFLLYIARWTSNFPLSGCGGPNPPPPNQEFEVNIRFKSKCSVTTSCLNRLDYDDAIICDNHNLASKYIVLNGRAYWRSFQEKYCGEKCCSYVIKVKCATSPINSEYIPTYSKTIVDVTACPPITYTECYGSLTPPPNPKVSNCGGNCKIGDLP